MVKTLYLHYIGPTPSVNAVSVMNDCFSERRTKYINPLRG
jgi:hypothetical protein